MKLFKWHKATVYELPPRALITLENATHKDLEELAELITKAYHTEKSVIVTNKKLRIIKLNKKPKVKK